MSETKKKVELDEKVTVNTDEQQGPLDGASAVVNMVKTVFPQEENGKMVQTALPARLMASYELGICSITSIDEKVMFTVRLDEMAQVLYASAQACKKSRENGDKPDENKES